MLLLVINTDYYANDQLSDNQSKYYKLLIDN